MNVLIKLAGFVAGSYIVYKGLTYTAGSPTVTVVPDHVDFFGDDQMTFIQGLHAENRLEPIKQVTVGPGLSQIQVNNAIFESNPQVLQEIQESIPNTLFLKDW